MKMILTLAVALSGLHAVSAVRNVLKYTSGSASAGNSVGAGVSVGAGAGGSFGKSAAEAATSVMVMDMLTGNGPSLKHISETTYGKMNLQDAMARLDGKLPTEVASLVRLDSSAAAKSQGFSEASLQKARRILNGMIESSWLDLDAAIIECKEFCLRNRKTYAQVVTDLNRLGAQIADLERKRTEAGQGIVDADTERKIVEGELQVEKENYMTKRLEDEAEITIRKNDLAVFDFILDMTRCKGSEAAASQFLQLPGSSGGVHVCNTKDGAAELSFADPKVQAKFQKLIAGSKTAGSAVRDALVMHLEQVQLVENATKDDIPWHLAPAGAHACDHGATASKDECEAAVQSLATATGNAPGRALAIGSGGTCLDGGWGQVPLGCSAQSGGDWAGHYKESGDTGLGCIASGYQLVCSEPAKVFQPAGTTTVPPPPPPTVPPPPPPAAGSLAKKCTDGKPNCGLLHDTMSMQWGKFKDLVDELTVEMDKDEDTWNNLKGDFNDQLTSIAAMRTSAMELLAETISNLNADNDERTEKDNAEVALRHEYEKRMAEYKARISEILFTNICAVRKVRNAVMKFSSTSPPSKITDCDISDWVVGECSVPCDDACPQADPYACGGWQALTREPIVPPNAFGIKCPPLTNKKKCNQIKCPVDCLMSEWSTWSKCTKECEGGVQGKTRAIITKPKNGGKFCDTVQESRSCNTGSCDRDCTLHDWIEWSPCSMACGGGIQTRIRKVDVPIRGQGKCPKSTSAFRSGEKMCNEQDCVGDEICIAHQDLIIALDASGSLRQDGFDVLRKFVGNLTDRYAAEMYGESDMQVGAMLFGNGHLEPDGTITPAMRVQDLTSDTASVKTAILATTWQKGFTNLAQAFALADTMLGQGGRADAQSAVLVVTDGKPSFKFQTAVKAKGLHDENTMIYMAAVTSAKGDDLKFLQDKIVSQPWETNFVRIPGLLALKHNQEVFEKLVVATFCPNAISPSKLAAQENVEQFMLIHEQGFPDEDCAPFYDLGFPGTMQDCMNAARTSGQLAFAYGKGKRTKGHCYAEGVAVTQEKWALWQKDRKAPSCPGGDWEANPYYDTYAIKPAVEA